MEYFLEATGYQKLSLTAPEFNLTVAEIPQLIILRPLSFSIEDLNKLDWSLFCSVALFSNHLSSKGDHHLISPRNSNI